MQVNKNMNSNKGVLVCVLDFDDTIFPTYWLDVMDELFTDNLLSIDEIISEMFSCLLKTCIIYIVSSASTEWLERSLLRIPNTHKIIKANRIEIISAKNTKKEFHFKDIYDKHPEAELIAALGDGMEEMVGCHKLRIVHKFRNKILKVRFKNKPTWNELVTQQKMVINHWEEWIKHERKDLNIKLI